MCHCGYLKLAEPETIPGSRRCWFRLQTAAEKTILGDIFRIFRTCILKKKKKQQLYCMILTANMPSSVFGCCVHQAALEDISRIHCAQCLFLYNAVHIHVSADWITPLTRPPNERKRRARGSRTERSPVLCFIH